MQMKHYGIAEWAAFARALAPETDLTAMQDHLSGGCSECRQTVDFCDRLAAVCGGMVGREVPESAVRLAQAIFPAQAPPRPRRVARIPVCLKHGKLVLAEARSNRFGEFQMEYEQQGRIQLCIYLSGGSQCIQVPIKKLATDRRSFAGRVNGGAPARSARSEPLGK